MVIGFGPGLNSECLDGLRAENGRALGRIRATDLKTRSGKIDDRPRNFFSLLSIPPNRVPDLPTDSRVVLVCGSRFLSLYRVTICLFDWQCTSSLVIDVASLGEDHAIVRFISLAFGFWLRTPSRGSPGGSVCPKWNSNTSRGLPVLALSHSNVSYLCGGRIRM
jgi:hypothetical protein